MLLFKSCSFCFAFEKRKKDLLKKFVLLLDLNTDYLHIYSKNFYLSIPALLIMNIGSFFFLIVTHINYSTCSLSKPQ